MNADKYTELAQRTSAPNFFDRKVSYGNLIEVLEGISKYAARLDTMKKAMFYGKTPQKTDAQDLSHETSVYGRDLGFTEAEKRQVHAIIGVITEAGELAEILLNALVLGNGIDAPHVGEEMGDVLWYIAESAAHGTPMSQMMGKNIEKLVERYPSLEFDAEFAAHRNLAAEDAVLGKVKISR
ncbi:putative MazG-related protein [Achromobacter phage vB_AxyS_19-32_Axy19]|nr:putative MazG-related protein [Achromobacter phage vB_AxyS_19-32_Axy19]